MQRSLKRQDISCTFLVLTLDGEMLSGIFRIGMCLFVIWTKKDLWMISLSLNTQLHLSTSNKSRRLANSQCKRTRLSIKTLCLTQTMEYGPDTTQADQLWKNKFKTWQRILKLWVSCILWKCWLETSMKFASNHFSTCKKQLQSLCIMIQSQLLPERLLLPTFFLGLRRLLTKTCNLLSGF